MNVRDVQISLRPRKKWEAVDLGFMLTRQHYSDLFKIGVIVLVPLWILIIIASWQVSWLALLIVWFLKPIYGRFYLLVFSRRIFGSAITVRQVLTKTATLLFKGSLPLLFRRLSAARSMNLAVHDLEKLKGSVYSRRSRTIRQVGGDVAIATTWVMLFCEILILAGVFLLVMMMIANEQIYSSGYFQNLAYQLYDSKLLETLVTIFYAVVVLAFEPFYVGAGFCLYLNSRSSQEAWDVELRFKEFTQRVRKSVIATAQWVLPLVMGMWVATSSAQDSVSPNTPQKTIERIYQDDDFEIHTEKIKEWQPYNWAERFTEWWENLFDQDSKPISERKVGAVDGLFKVLGIVVLTVLVGVIAWLIVMRISDGKIDFDLPEMPVNKRRPSVVLGMDITEKSLPADLIQAAQKEWQAGNYRVAISLLYRGALSKVVIEHQADIDSSYTEYECMRAAKQVLPTPSSSYFDFLSGHWITVAYSSDPVSDAQFQSLCQQWPFATK